MEGGKFFPCDIYSGLVVLVLIMSHPVPIGVAEQVVDTGDLACVRHADGSTPLFVGAIMHTLIPTRGFNTTVRVSATPEDIARALNGRVSVDHIRDVWLADNIDHHLNLDERCPVTPKTPPRHSELSSSTEHNRFARPRYNYHFRADVPRYNPIRARLADTERLTELSENSTILKPNGALDSSGSPQADRQNMSLPDSTAFQPAQPVDKSEDEVDYELEAAQVCTADQSKKIASDSPRLSSSMSSSVTDGATVASPPVPGMEVVIAHDFGGTLSTSSASSPERRQAGSTASSSGKSALGRGHFDELFVNRPILDDASKAFAAELMAKLSELAESCPSDSRSGGVQDFAANGAATVHVAPPSKTCSRFRKHSSSPSPSSCESSRHGSDESPECGFGAAHEAVSILCDGFAICKTGKGIYRTAFGRSAARPRSNSQTKYYVEVHVVEDCGGDGMCIGLATPHLKLNQVVGANSSSVGLHSSGKLVCGNDFLSYAKHGFSKNDRVGCKVSFASKKSAKFDGPAAPACSLETSAFSPLEALRQDASGWVEVEFFVNGMSCGIKSLPLFVDVPSSERVLYPAVSLFRTDSKAIIRCCPMDWEGTKDDSKLRGVESFCAGQ